ncbi:MAG: hypothetical protein FWD49_05225 [Firmicutes bacterium]|nr:hypothetical protein [Bacillota bacterium]
MKKKEFTYTREEITAGKTRYGTPVYDGIFGCVDTNKWVRIREQCVGTNLIRKNGKTFKVKGKDDISTSIHRW